MTFVPEFYKSAILDPLGGPSNPSMYQVIIIPPVGLTSALGGLGVIPGGLGAAAVSLCAERAELPGRQFATTDHTMYGTKVKMPYATLYDDLSLSFLCTNIMAQRMFFDAWQGYIHNPYNNYMRYYKDYTARIIVAKLDNSASFTGLLSLATTYIFDQCYPVTIQSQELSYENGNDYLKLTVQFAYKKWSTPLDAALDAIGAFPKGPEGATPVSIPGASFTGIDINETVGNLVSSIVT